MFNRRSSHGIKESKLVLKGFSRYPSRTSSEITWYACRCQSHSQITLRQQRSRGRHALSFHYVGEITQYLLVRKRNLPGIMLVDEVVISQYHKHRQHDRVVASSKYSFDVLSLIPLHLVFTRVHSTTSWGVCSIKSHVTSCAYHSTPNHTFHGVFVMFNKSIAIKQV
jgi:hypothetical protein